jgi:hypothetical protein
MFLSFVLIIGACDQIITSLILLRKIERLPMLAAKWQDDNRCTQNEHHFIRELTAALGCRCPKLTQRNLQSHDQWCSSANDFFVMICGFETTWVHIAHQYARIITTLPRFEFGLCPSYSWQISCHAVKPSCVHVQKKCLSVMRLLLAIIDFNIPYLLTHRHASLLLDLYWSRLPTITTNLRFSLCFECKELSVHMALVLMQPCIIRYHVISLVEAFTVLSARHSQDANLSERTRRDKHCETT